MRRLFCILPIVLLSACATAVDRQTQHVTMRTPGAENARCTIENQDMKYSIWTDETIEIMKSPNDLVINCVAPGNREKTVHVKRHLNEWVYTNVWNGFLPGAGYDYFSRGAFKYPSEFVVSFAGDQVKPYPMPAHYNKDLKHNNVYNKVVYRGPSVPVTEENRYDQPYVTERIDHPHRYDLDFMGGSPSKTTSGSGDALDYLHNKYNPDVGDDSTEEDK